MFCVVIRPGFDDDEQRQVADELAAVELRVALDRAETLAVAGDFDEATVALDSARAWLAVVGTDRDQRRVFEIEERIALMRDMANESDRRIAYERLQAQQRQEIATAQARKDALQGVRVVELEKVVELRRRGEYQEALALARDMSVRYPDDKVVQELYQQIEDLAVKQRTNDYEERRAYLQQEAFRQVEEMMIPDGLDGRPQFPMIGTKKLLGQRQWSKKSLFQLGNSI